MYKEISANKRKTVYIMMIFLLFVAGLAWLFGMYAGNTIYAIVIGVVGIVYATISYFVGSRMALAVNRAQRIDRTDNQRLYRIVENIAITDGLPMPQVYIIDDPAPNAFATGRNPDHSSVTVTRGLLDIMNDTELEGVIAHEMGHIKNYDIRVSMIVFALVAVVSLIADIIFQMTWFRNSDEEEGGQIIFIAGIIAAIIAPIIATLIQLAVSRRREYLADATGALTTRYPEGLASALQKIEQHGSTLRRQSPSTAHFFFANPLRGHSLTNLFSTHPPIEERIARLQHMDTEA